MRSQLNSGVSPPRAFSFADDRPSTIRFPSDVTPNANTGIG
jgi:hypothetical protein